MCPTVDTSQLPQSVSGSSMAHLGRALVASAQLHYSGEGSTSFLEARAGDEVRAQLIGQEHRPEKKLRTPFHLQKLSVSVVHIAVGGACLSSIQVTYCVVKK